MFTVLQHVVVSGGLYIVRDNNDGHQLGDGTGHYVYFHHTIPLGTVQETR